MTMSVKRLKTECLILIGSILYPTSTTLKNLAKIGPVHSEMIDLQRECTVKVNRQKNRSIAYSPPDGQA